MRMRKRNNLAPRMEACSAIWIKDGTERKGKWRELMPGAKELRLEVGCGKGKFTVETAEANPDVLFLAVECVQEAMLLGMEKALKIGFTGVMYDGSVLPYEENVANTQTAVAMGKEYGANVEAEIGQLASREGGTEANAAGPVYTDPDLAVQFCKETGIDALAPSFGTAHGIYKSKPVLDLDRVKTIAEKTGLPLVMHGGSGVSDEDYRIAIANGIRKINYYSYMSKAGVSAVQSMLDSEDVTFFHDLALRAQKAMEENVTRALMVFSGM